MNSAASVREDMTARDGVRLAQELVRFASLNPPGEEAACIAFLVGLLEAGGMDVKTYEFAPSRPSIVARVAGRSKEPPLCFTGHIDVVPVGNEPWTVPPFEGRIVDGKLFGRGTSDMKAGVGAFVAATLQRLDKGKALERGITLVITAGEETGCEGAFHLARIGALGDAALLIVAEPSSNQAIIAHKGSMRIGVKVRGRTAHSSMPDVGENAIDKAVRMLARLQGHCFDIAPHPLLGSTTACVTTISGGQNINSVPDVSMFTIDLRTIPDHAHSAIRAEIETLFGPDAEIEIITDFPGFSTKPEEPLLETLAQIMAGETGALPKFLGAPYFTDASALVPGFNGVPTVILGPGEVEQCHRTDEFCYVLKIEECQKIYISFIDYYCK